MVRSSIHVGDAGGTELERARVFILFLNMTSGLGLVSLFISSIQKMTAAGLGRDDFCRSSTEAIEFQALHVECQ